MRRCNECTLCCKLLPVSEIGKLAGTPCTQQRSKGCRVYGTDAFPNACHVWSCMWLMDERLALPRPDRAHYVLDPSPEFITIASDPPEDVRVVQIWIDPRFPHAHRDPALRAWLAQRWDSDHVLGLVRFDARAGLTLIPPSASGRRKWMEVVGQATTEHTAEQVAATLRRIGR